MRNKSKVGRILMLKGKIKNLDPEETLELAKLGHENPHILDSHVRQDLMDRIDYLLWCNHNPKEIASRLSEEKVELLKSGYASRENID